MTPSEAFRYAAEEMERIRKLTTCEEPAVVLDVCLTVVQIRNMCTAMMVDLTSLLSDFPAPVLAEAERLVAEHLKGKGPVH